MGAEKPNVLERLGSALNSRDLECEIDRHSQVDLIAALALTQVNPSAIEHEKLEQALIDPGTELGAVLVRIKYGGDRKLNERAVRLLILWVRHQRAFRKWKLRANGESLLEKFVRTGFDEWLDPTCQICCGRELLGLERGAISSRRVRCKHCKGSGELNLLPATAPWREYSARTVRRPCPPCHGMGAITIHRQVKEKPGECWSCKGTGIRRATDAERARALSIDVKVYQRHWARRFSWLGSALDRVDHTEKRCLQAQMEHGIKR